ncbi:MAG: hypothetical protein M1828_003415 [Chrysothrix sp. TS-e1954]|nr:MAG: hypothetical protein M1828_003415 [Chrysothrix sp. TS-e1954]
MNIFRAWQQAVLGTNETVNGSITYNTSSAQATFVRETRPTSSLGILSLNTGSLVSDFVGAVRALENLDGIFGYLVSPWALVTLFVALVLNRAQVYASTRSHIYLRWPSRLFLRLVPILLLLHQLLTILETIHCQGGGDIPQIRRGKDKIVNSPWSNDLAPIYRLARYALFWQDEHTSCLNRGMIPSGDDNLAFTGSTRTLWPLFSAMCLSHTAETISCALQGRQPRAETGMTLFEHSLAFAEAETVVKSNAGIGGFRHHEILVKKNDDTAPLTLQMLFNRLNVTPEVLAISLISCLSHLTSQVIGVLGVQQSYRFLNTTIWGLCYISAFVWSFFKFFRPSTQYPPAVVRYPTVCIIGFIPHILIIIGIILCGFIYFFAIVATVLSSGGSSQARSLSIKDRLVLAHRNMQANISFAGVRIGSGDEFFTTLLKVGFKILSAATEAVYFNEGLSISTSSSTWLDRERRRTAPGKTPPELMGDLYPAEGLGLIEEHNPPTATSPYACERKTAPAKTNRAGSAAIQEVGVRGAQRQGRWYMCGRLIWGILELATCCFAKATLLLLRPFPVQPNSQRLRKLARVERRSSDPIQPPAAQVSKPLDFWILSSTGELNLPTDTNVDVELETRKRLRNSSRQDVSDEAIDTNLYNWWRNNGWWGEVDGSGDFRPASASEDDTTSVISSTASTADAWESQGSEDSGARTPTRDNPDGRSSPSEDPLANLAQLLEPRSLQAREEARLLARRLTRKGPTTRSQYQADLHPSILAAADRRLTPDEEEAFLEQLIADRRHKPNQHVAGNFSARADGWSAGAAGLGSSGPQCVICQTSPRTVLVWPCRCLSLCEDCRVKLAVDNYSTCVCCRRDVVAFSRLFVP